MNIIFTALRYKNFIGAGNVFTEIQLRKAHRTLILGPNGAGKSTFLDALCFVLFKRPFRKITLPQLVNTVNNRDCLVEVEFSIGSNEFLVRRGIKPSIFEIFQNGKLINQDSKTADYQLVLEQRILALTYDSFKQIVILGNASYTPFMQLKVPERREFVEYIFDIQLFSRMNLVLKDQLADVKRSIAEIDGQLLGVKEQAVLIEGFIAKLQTDRQKEMIEAQARIAEVLEAIETSVHDVLTRTEELNALAEQIDDAEQVQEQLTIFNEQTATIRSKIKAAQTKITFYVENATCKQCGQDISEDHRTRIQAEKQSQIEKLEDGLVKLNRRIEKYQNRVQEIREVSRQVKVLSSDIERRKASIQANRQYVATMQRSTRKEGGNVQEEQTKLEQVRFRSQELERERDLLIDRRHYYEVAAVLLRDTGIKASIIRQYLPVLVKLANKYLAALDFFVCFELDENFSETFKARHRDALSYFAFSEGEKKRVDLAMMFAWREVARLKNSATTNLLILDEVLDSSLDEVGMDCFLQLLNQTTNASNVFIISHRGQGFTDRFSETIHFQKEGNFSKATLIAA